MLTKVLFLFVLVDFSLQKSNLKVSVHYESFQGASKSSIVESIVPGYKQLKDEVDFEFEFIPYGNAKLEGGNVKCPQGEKECLANKIQVCALAENATMDNKVLFVNCAMMQEDPADVFLLNVCIKYWKFDIAKVKPCYEGPRGEELLQEFGRKTSDFSQHIPAIVFNGVFDEKLSQQARDHFVYVVCEMLKEKPKVCSTLKY